jgi:hypothetical protein
VKVIDRNIEQDPQWYYENNQDPKPYITRTYYTKTIEYQIAAQPSDILNFYAGALSKDEWFEGAGPSQNGLVPAGDRLFTWHQAGINGPTDTAFRIGISAVALTNKSTMVRLEIVRFDPR